MADDSQLELRRALKSDDVAAAETLLKAHPELISEATGCPPVTLSRSVTMARRLIKLGASVAEVGKWWASGMGTRTVDASVARFLVEQGAQLTVHAAAGLGLGDRLKEMLDADPELVHAKGGDGCTPLHFARDLATARLLLEGGARVDARDEDHDSTPAQWLIGDAPEIARLLLERGAHADIFLAAALGDLGLAQTLVTANRECVRQRIGKGSVFPPLGNKGPKGPGGTIYQWTLGFNSYPHQIALKKGHRALFDYLFQESDVTTRFLVSCVQAHRAEAESIARANPGLVASLESADLELPALYCWETNLSLEAVRLMLDLGFPLTHPETNHGYTPLHNAAWAGDANLVDLLLKRGHPVDIVDPGYNSTPLGYAIYDCLIEKRHPEGNFARVAELLIDAGSPWSALCYPTGNSDLDAALKARLQLKPEGAAILGDAEAVFQLLGNHPAQGALARSLAGAAKGGHAVLCQRLIEAGAFMNEPLDENKNTPLTYALKSGSSETIKVFKERGA